MKCKKCGYELEKNEKFCPSCGERVELKKVCPACGTELEENIKFCPACGKRIEEKNIRIETEKESTAKLNVSEAQIIGKNNQYYEKQFQNMRNGEKCKLNWASLFLGIFHAAYRGVWKEWLKKPGLPLIIGIATSIIGGIAQLFSGSFTIMAITTGIVGISSVISGIMQILYAFQFNKVYMKHVEEKVGKGDSRVDTSIGRAIAVIAALSIAAGIGQAVLEAGTMESLFGELDETLEIESQEYTYNNETNITDETIMEVENTTESETEGETESHSLNFQVGESVMTDKFEFTVTDAYVVDYLGEHKKIPEGAVYVAVEYEYKNISKQPIRSGEKPNIMLADGNDAIYNQDADANLYFDGYSDEKLISDMNPGIKTKGAKIFEVAIDVLNAGGMKVYVEADKSFLVDLLLSYEEPFVDYNVTIDNMSGYYEEPSGDFRVSISIYSSSGDDTIGSLELDYGVGFESYEILDSNTNVYQLFNQWSDGLSTLRVINGETIILKIDYWDEEITFTCTERFIS